MYAQGATYREVAEACGISPETVNPMLKAAARNLGLGRRIARAGLREALDV
jgi:DNA-binding CsgD family transcriptional regulator